MRVEGSNEMLNIHRWKVSLSCVWTVLAMKLLMLSLVNSSSASFQQACVVKNRVANCSMAGLSGHIPNLPNDTKTLIFSFNNLTNVNKETFAVLKHLPLETITLNYCDIRAISIDAFEYLKFVKKIDLSGNRFKKFDNLTTALSHTNIQVLTLEDVRKSKWNGTTFQPLTKLPITELNLANNRLTQISPHGVNISWFKNLTKLNLNFNDISTFSLIGDQLPNIKKLYLRGNQLRKLSLLCNGRTEKFWHLKFVDISKNSITELTKKTMNASSLAKVVQLVLTENRIAYVHNNVLASLPSLTNLTLEITGTNSPKLKIDEFAFNSTSLKELTLKMNDKELDPADPKVQRMFRHCPQLRDLTLRRFKFSNTNMTQIREIFSPLTNLQRLTISSGRIVQIPTDLITDMKHLEYLSFRNNYISSWDPEVFKKAYSLKTLILSINQITHLNATALPKMLWRNLTVLDLAYNPFDCTCELEWFRNYIKRHEGQILSFPKYYFCKSPLKWKDSRLVRYNPSFLECHHLGPLETGLITVGSILIVIIVITIVLNKYKWHIKHYIYLMRTRRQYQKIPDGEDFTYHAFVSYESADRIWVFSQLRPFLEEKHNFRLCLHERDFRPGKLIVDNITDNLQNSQKIIMILSNSFAKSRWCQFEILMAHNRYLEEGESALVLVMLEEISSRYVGGPLKLLLNSVTYAQWTNDQVGKELFWDKIVTSFK